MLIANAISSGAVFVLQIFSVIAALLLTRKMEFTVRDKKNSVANYRADQFAIVVYFIWICIGASSVVICSVLLTVFEH
jgi:hypothetical protein